MGNPAGVLAQKSRKRRLKQELRIQGNAIKQQQAIKRGNDIATALEGKADPNQKAMFDLYQLSAAADVLAQRLGLDHVDEAAHSETTDLVSAVSVVLDEGKIGPIVVGVTDLNSPKIASVEQICRQVLGSEQPYRVELTGVIGAGIDAFSSPSIGTASGRAAGLRWEGPGWFKRLFRQRSNGFKGPSNTMVGGNPIFVVGEQHYEGTATGAAIPKNLGQESVLKMAGHVAQAVEAAIHHSTSTGPRIGKVGAVSKSIAQPPTTSDAAYGQMDNGWRAIPAIQNVGEVVSIGGPDPGIEYEVCGRYLGHWKCELVRAVSRFRMTLPDDKTKVVLLKQFEFRLKPGHRSGVRGGDSGGPIFLKLSGQSQKAHLVGMLIARDLKDPQLFYVTSMLSVHDDLDLVHKL